MKTVYSLPRLVLLLALCLGGLVPSLSATILPPTVVSVRAVVPETREPFCDPAICDAPVPAPGVFVFTRRGTDVARELYVSISFGGSASSGVDYPILPMWVMFRPGALTAELQVPATFDLLLEGDEFVVAQVLPDPTMGPIARYTVDPSQAVARVLIRDNGQVELPTVRIDATSRIAEETSAPLRRLALRGRLTVSRTGSLENPLSVFVHYGGTATAGADYGSLPWLVNIPAGTNSIDIDIAATPDDLAESIEFIDATLSECPPLTSPPMGIPCYQANIDPAHASARVFIRDDGITTATIALNAPRDGSSFLAGAPIRILATAIDLDGAITRVQFLDGETRIGESELLFIREPDPGTPIQHEFLWDGAAVGAHAISAVGLNAAGERVISPVANIRVMTGLPVVSIEATVPETREPSPTIRVIPGKFTLRRAGDTSRLLRVWMRYSGTATSGLDYLTLPGVVEFPIGSDSVELQVGALEDAIVEGDETVVAQIVPSPLAIAPDHQIDPVRNAARVVIHDSTEIPPTEPVVTITAVDGFAREGANAAGLRDPAVFAIARTGPTNNPLVVHLAVAGTASNGVDYDEIGGTIEIPAGERRARLVVWPKDDRNVEGIETVIVGLVQIHSILPSYRVGFPGRAAAIIVDNDRVRPPCLWLPDGLFNLCVPVPVEHCYRVEVTRDFKEWTPLCTLPVTEGSVHFVDPDAPERPRGFYRLVPVPCEP